jgi:2-dehydro-3-deoxygluconokinase
MDVIALGEAMIRLTPPDFRRLEQAYSLNVEIGGAELNTAVGLTRLGRSSSWISRLPDNPLGRLLANRARETGVATDQILFAKEDRMGLYFLEFGAAPRASSILYDRADSAMSHLKPGELDWSTIFAGSRWFYVTGITAALSPSTAEATLEALRAAKAAGLSTCLDPNYRAKLWSVEQAKAWLTEAITLIDVLVTNPEDADRFFGSAGKDPETIAKQLAERYRLQAVAMTFRETPSVWRNVISAVGYSEGKFLKSRTYEVEIVDRLGSGDTFVAGLLHGLLDNDLQRGLDYGTAMSALKHSIPGDLPWITKSEVEDLIAGGGMRISR